jgi:uncharacterized protein YuzE
MAVTVDNYLRLVPELRDLPSHSAQISYDQEGDVLYVSFAPGEAADEGDEVARDVIARYKDGQVIGYTILNASLHGVAS